MAQTRKNSPQKTSPSRTSPGKTGARKTKPAAPKARSTGSILRRNALPLAGALAGGLAAAAAAIFFTRRDAPAAGHPAPDLVGDDRPDRADPHFRPDMDAPMSAADRAALTPPLGRPTLVDG